MATRLQNIADPLLDPSGIDSNVTEPKFTFKKKMHGRRFFHFGISDGLARKKTAGQSRIRFPGFKTILDGGAGFISPNMFYAKKLSPYVSLIFEGD